MLTVSSRIYCRSNDFSRGQPPSVVDPVERQFLQSHPRHDKDVAEPGPESVQPARVVGGPVHGRRGVFARHEKRVQRWGAQQVINMAQTIIGLEQHEHGPGNVVEHGDDFAQVLLRVAANHNVVGRGRRSSSSSPLSS
jgi:hypothetical protein